MEQKKCPVCHETKDVTEFNKSSAKKYGVNSYCRSCDNRKNKEWHQKNKVRRLRAKNDRKDAIGLEIREYKRTLSCIDCGIAGKDFPEIIDFDHTGKDKKKEVSLLTGQGFGMTTIFQEIAKCEPVCSNCHRIRTFKRRVGVG